MLGRAPGTETRAPHTKYQKQSSCENCDKNTTVYLCKDIAVYDNACYFFCADCIKDSGGSLLPLVKKRNVSQFLRSCFMTVIRFPINLFVLIAVIVLYLIGIDILEGIKEHAEDI